MTKTPAPASRALLDSLRYEQRISDIDRKPLSMIEHWSPLLEASIEGAREHYRLSKTQPDDGEDFGAFLDRIRPDLERTNRDRLTFEKATAMIARHALRFDTPRSRAILTEHAARMYVRYSQTEVGA